MPNGEFRSSTNTRPRLGDAVAVRVAQQRDAVRARHGRAGVLHEPCFMNQPLMPLPVLGPRRRVGLGDQHVAVGQHVAASADESRSAAKRVTEHAVGRVGVRPPASPSPWRRGRSGSAPFRRRQYGIRSGPLLDGELRDARVSGARPRASRTGPESFRARLMGIGGSRTWAVGTEGGRARDHAPADVGAPRRRRLSDP